MTVTLELVRKLSQVSKEERNKILPNWEVEVLKYCIYKQSVYKTREKLYIEAKRQFEELVVLLKKMGVVW